jgi:hypothetical protein
VLHDAWIRVYRSEWHPIVVAPVAEQQPVGL